VKKLSTVAEIVAVPFAVAGMLVIFLGWTVPVYAAVVTKIAITGDYK
jgi:hypothetical protein